MTPSSRPRLEALTGLRYLAALSVLIAHMAHNFPEGFAGDWLGTLSALGMPLFFTLSGFLMAYNYSLPFQQKFRRTLWTYYVARFARIYPVYIACLLLSFSFMGCFFNDLNERPREVAKTMAFDLTLTQSWAHVVVFRDMNPRPVSQAYLGVAWSVSTEAFFYLMFPLVAIPLARFVTGRGRMLLGAAGVFALYLLVGYLLARRIAPEAFASPAFGNGKQWWRLYLSPYMRFGEFLIGAFAGQYFLLRSNQPAATGWRWWAGATGLLTAAVVFVLANFVILMPQKFGFTSPTPKWLFLAGQNVLFAPLCAIIIYQLAALPSLAQRALGCRPMVVLGEMSYCMYLLHPLAQSFYHLRAVGEGPLTAPHVIVFNNLALVAVLHLMCLGMYRYLEVPAREWLRARLDPKPKLKLAVPHAPPLAA